jgi:hypothetical protein
MELGRKGNMKRKTFTLLLCTLLLTGCSSVEEPEIKVQNNYQHNDRFVPLVKVNDDMYVKEDILKEYEDQYIEMNGTTIEDLMSSDIVEDSPIPEFVDIQFTDDSNTEYDFEFKMSDLELELDNLIDLYSINSELNSELGTDLQYYSYMVKALEKACVDKNIDISSLEYMPFSFDDPHISEYCLWKLKNGNTFVYMYVSEAGNDIKINIGD